MYYNALKFQIMENIVRDYFQNEDKDLISEDDIIDLLECNNYSIEDIFDFLNFFEF